MTDSLRAKQNMEILDVFKNLNSQVVGLQNKQVQQFSESLKPKTQRDLGSEVNVDKAVENINKTLEAKLGALEFVVQNINPENRGAEGQDELTTQANRNTFYTALTQVNNTGDVVPLWNSIVRAYQVSGVSRETQQVIKVKVQELTPNLEAINYGINQAIDTIFGRKIVKGSFAGTILELLRSLSIYNEVKAQVDSNPPRFELLSVDLLDRAFKNIFESQSADRLTILKQYAPRGLITSSTIRNIPDFKTGDIDQRIKEIEEEMGFKIPRESRDVFADRLKQLSGVELTNAINELKHQVIPSHKHKMEQKKITIMKQAEDLEELYMQLSADYMEADVRLHELQREVDELEEGQPIAEDEIMRRRLPEIELPVEPVRPDFLDFFNYQTGEIEQKDYEEAMHRFHEAHDEFMREYINMREVEAYNQHLQDMAIRSNYERRQRINELEREFVATREAHRHLEQRMREVEEEQAQVSEYLRDNRLEELEPVMNALLGDHKLKSLHATSKATARRIQSEAEEKKEDSDSDVEVDLGFGKPVERRGMSSLKKGYGYQDIQVQKKKQMHFDDRGNDNYYTKPVM